MELFNNHKKLFTTAFLFFAALTTLVAIVPALDNQKKNAPLPDAVPLSAAAQKGKAIYIANGCVACHTQQVRNVEMDKTWGQRPGIAADYAAVKRTDTWRNTATLMGTERTGPDLTDLGNRQPSQLWNLVHLYNPRIVVKESIMPAYPWLFRRVEEPAANDVVINVPAEFSGSDKGKIVASPEALQLVAYLQSLKQVKLPDGNTPPDFLYPRPAPVTASGKSATAGPAGTTDAADQPDGAALYAANCQSCHQAGGEGLAGAFPSLKGSAIVNGDNLELYVDIIMNGYDANPSFGVMAPVGTNMNFTEKEVAAIINHERSSWGNKGIQVSPEEIKKIMDLLKLKNP